MTTTIPAIHPDWYADGIDCGRDLWRLDLPGDIQVQASINVTNVQDELDGEPPAYGDDAEIFIEHDVRGAGKHGDERTKYSGDDFKVSPEEFCALLAMGKTEAERRLHHDIRRVQLMPNDPRYCKEAHA